MSFWASKLNGEQPKPVVLPSRDMFGVYNTIPQQQTSQQHSIPQQQEYVPTVSLTSGGTCPSCGSDRFMGRHTTGAVMACPDCGFNEKFQQFGHGLKSLDSKGSATPARQTNDSQTMGMAMAQLSGTATSGEAPQARVAYTPYN